MKKLCLVTSTILMVVLLVVRSYAQQGRDTVQHNSSVTNALNYFDKEIGQQSRLYNGPEYGVYDFSIAGNPFFPDAKNWITGSVTYDDFGYKNVPLMYDVYKDIVVALLYNKVSKYVLLSERVNDFKLGDLHFIRVNNNTADKNGLQTGFYQVLYNGSIQVLVKHTKEIETSTNNQTSTPERYFSAKTHYYLKKNNEYYPFSGQSALLTLLKEKKKELQQMLKSNNVSYKDNPESAMVTIATYYDRLNQ